MIKYKYTIELPNEDYEQHEVEAYSAPEAVDKVLSGAFAWQKLAPVRPELREDGNYVGWLELKIRVSPALEEDNEHAD